MNKTTLRVLSVGLVGAILLGLRTIFFTPGSTVTNLPKSNFTTQSAHQSASPQVQAETNYVPFDPRFGLQGTQRSTPRDRRSGKSEPLSP